ncbi:MAG: hypothetical protein J6T01_01865 [Kiritimatiellae bacterium]|nr:hypothetical protein [Kiritimatiellia bacterium]
MRINPKWGWLAAFTAVFAVLVGYVFWGAWSPDFAPVMPDNPTTHSPYWFTEWWRGLLVGGIFAPGDLLQLLGGPYAWQELKYAASVYCAALGTAYFCRGLGLSRPASYGAALLLSFSGYWLTLYSAGHYGWFQWMTYGVFAFGLVDRAVRGDGLRHWVLLGACTAWASFYQPDMWLLFTAFTGVYFIYRSVSERRLPWKGILISAAAFALIAAPGVLNAFTNSLAGRKQQIEEGQTVGAAAAAADSADKQWIFATNWSLPPGETAELFARRIKGDTSCPLTLSVGLQRGSGVKPYTGALGRPFGADRGGYRQHSLYAGLVTCLLAVCGVFFGGRKCLFFAVAGAVFWVFSLGRNCEAVYRLVYALPFGGYLRAPVKWLHLTEFCLAVLAGFGVDGFLNSRFSASGKVSLRRAVFCAVCSAVLIGAADLASVAKLYCAPVDVGAARRSGSVMQMAVLQRRQFADPQVAAMVRDGGVVSIANYLGNPDYFLVGTLEKCKPPEPLKSGEVRPLKVTLGLLSLAGTIAAAVIGVLGAVPRKGAAA